MNVIELLKKDHRAVSQLFKSYERAKESEEDGARQEIAREICQELTAHATIEEEIFYPAVDAKAESEGEHETLDTVDEADEEHRIVKALVAEIQAMEEDDDHFDAKMKVLKDLVDHHVEEEEAELMPQATELFKKAELEEMGSQAAARKKELEAEDGEVATPVGAKEDRTRPRLVGTASKRATAPRKASKA
jgi:hemerythrin superfamily protein